MILIPALNTWINSGDFIHAMDTVYSNQVGVCQVNEVQSCTTFSVTWWVEESLLDARYKMQRAPLIQDQLLNVGQCSIKEVFKMPSRQTVINVSDVVCLAFVFHASYLEHVWVNCAGMELVYFTRYFVDSDSSLASLPPDLQLPFMPSSVGESYPCRVWYSLMHVKDKVAQLLNVRTQMQACRRAVSVFFPLESWDFICKQLFPIISPVPFTKSQTKAQQFSDLSLCTKTTVVSCLMLRIIDEGSMDAARKLFGRTFGIGCRNIPPQKGHAVRKLLHGDIVNVVDVSSTENQEARRAVRFKEFIAAQGVEFVYEVHKRLLSIRVRYSSLNAEMPEVGRWLGFQQRVEAPLSTAASITNSSRPIAIGTNFLHRGELVVVIRCEGHSVLVRHDTNGLEESITLDLARDLIKKYIFG
jgi:hypothetical protein